MYEVEKPGETYEIATEEKRNVRRKKSSTEPAATEPSTATPRPATVKTSKPAPVYSNVDDYFDNDVTVEDDNNGDDEYVDEEETESDREFVNDDSDDDNSTNINLHRMLDHSIRINEFTDNGDEDDEDDMDVDDGDYDEEAPPSFVYPEGDYRADPYTPPELTDEEEELFNELFALINEKSVFPYEHMTSMKTLDETTLPSIERFYSKLTGQGITKAQHDRAIEIFEKFGMKTLRQYMILYLLMDVTLLADVLMRFNCVSKNRYRPVSFANDTRIQLAVDAKEDCGRHRPSLDVAERYLPVLRSSETRRILGD